MEQEPVYVPSGVLADVCADVLGRIYDRRQSDQQAYVQDRVAAHNAQVLRRNGRWWRKVLGLQPDMFITPHGMELLLQDEIRAMDPDLAQKHQIVQIHQQYGGLEHEAKDCLIQCKLNESVLVSAGFARGVSHLGVDLGFMRRPRFGFYPR